MTARDLAQRFEISVHALHKYVQDGILPPPKGRGIAATWDPICVKILTDYRFVREQLHATKADLAERRQLTGQLIPPVIERGSV